MSAEFNENVNAILTTEGHSAIHLAVLGGHAGCVTVRFLFVSVTYNGNMVRLSVITSLIGFDSFNTLSYIWYDVILLVQK